MVTLTNMIINTQCQINHTIIHGLSKSNLSNVAVPDKMGNNFSPPWPMASSKNVVSKAIPLVGLVVLVGGVVVPVVVSMVTSDKMQQCHGNNVVGVEEMGVMVPPVFVAMLAKENTIQDEVWLVVWAWLMPKGAMINDMAAVLVMG